MTRLAAVGGALLLTAVLVSPIQGQGRLDIGLSGGATYTTLSGDDVVDTESNWGFSGGLFIRERQQNWFADLEINLTKKGGKGTFEEQAIDLDLTYLEIPFILGLSVGATSSMELGLYGGIAFALRTGCGIGIADEARVGCSEETPGGDPKGSEWAVPVGAKLGLGVGAAQLILDGRYTLGLSQVFEDREIKNRGWGFLLHLALPFQRI